MHLLSRATVPGARIPFRRLALTVAAGVLFGSSSYAANFGHSRIQSGVGEPLVIMVPVSGLSAQDIQSLSAEVAPAADWAQAGLVPPVALDALRISVEPGVQPATRVLRIQSDQTLQMPLADLLIDVRTASGQQRYQVTLITGGAPAGSLAVSGVASSAGSSASSADAVGRSADKGTQLAIDVRKGDTMFAIARRHAVQGVTVYQMMMALQRTNPQAFIEQNVNLVKAGERLLMPGMDELLALSDREARRQFQIQSAAFAEYRARHGGAQIASLAQADQHAATQGTVSQAPEARRAPAAQGDQLRLSGAAAPGVGSPNGSGQNAAQSPSSAAQSAQALPSAQAQAQTQAQSQTPAQRRDQAQAEADTRAAQGKAVADAQGRVSQLEENVGHLSEALKAQGEAARSVIVDGAKDLSDSLADVASAVTQGNRDTASPANGAANQANVAGASGEPGVAGLVGASGKPGTAGTSGAAGASGEAGASGATGATGAAGTAGATGATGATGAAGATGATGGSGATGEPGTPGQAGASTATGSESSLSPASGASSSASSSPSSITPPVAAAPGEVTAAGSTAARADAVEHPITAKAGQMMSWLQEHLLGVMAALLAIIVLVITWLLRRANTGRDGSYEGARVTEAMVREKLENIDLDLTSTGEKAARREE